MNFMSIRLSVERYHAFFSGLISLFHIFFFIWEATALIPCVFLDLLIFFFLIYFSFFFFTDDFMNFLFFWIL